MASASRCRHPNWLAGSTRCWRPRSVLSVRFPREHLGMKAPGRDRTVRQLGFHVFRVSAAFADTREQGHLSEQWFEENAPAEMADGDAVARYGDGVRRRLQEYSARPGWCDGDVSTYYGPQTAHDFMERTTWHAAQHLRQIYWFLDQMGVRADAPLTDADLEGASVPARGVVLTL